MLLHGQVSVAREMQEQIDVVRDSMIESQINVNDGPLQVNNRQGKLDYRRV